MVNKKRLKKNRQRGMTRRLKTGKRKMTKEQKAEAKIKRDKINELNKKVLEKKAKKVKTE